MHWKGDLIVGVKSKIDGDCYSSESVLREEPEIGATITESGILIMAFICCSVMAPHKVLIFVPDFVVGIRQSFDAFRLVAKVFSGIVASLCQ
jgi:hypothetical protein